MTEYNNENRFTLFKNNRKEKDTHPDYNGTINVDGVEYYLNAWLKEGKNGKFFSGSIKLKDEKPKTDRVAEVKAQATKAVDPFDDEIGF